MTDNFKIFRDFISSDIDFVSKEDLFYTIAIISRSKDNPGLRTTVWKYFYIYSLNDFDKNVSIIKTLCDKLNARAYISVVHKSEQRIIEDMNVIISKRIYNHDYSHPFKIVETAISANHESSNRRWVYDLDDYSEDEARKLFNYISLNSFGTPWFIQTKHGYHIISKPISVQKLKDWCQENNYRFPDIKKNHISLLYENLK